MIGSRLAEVMDSLIDTAMSRIKADLMIENCNVVDVVTGEIYEASIAIKGDRIAYVGDSSNISAIKTIDAKSRYAVPGLIDAHAHPDYYLTLFEMAKIAVKHGTTCLFAEPDAAFNAMGIDGFRLFVDWAKRCDARVYVLIPFISPQDPGVEDANFPIDLDDLAEIAGELLVGMGEVVAWSALINGDEGVRNKVRWAVEKNLKILGHTAGARRQKLAAYAPIASSCHEAINTEQAYEKLRNGLHLMVRHGSIRKDLYDVLPAVQKCDVSWISLVSDGVEPSDAVNKGYMDWVVRESIELGIDPIDAIRMVTVNPARYYGMERDLGILAPPRYADMLLLKDLEKVEIDRVIVGGQIYKEDDFGDSSSYSSSTPLSVMNVKRKLKPDDIKIPVDDRAKLRIAELLSETVNREVVKEVKVQDGWVEGYHKAVLVERFRAKWPPVVSLLDGFGLKSGAIASTVCFDEYNIVAIGCNDEDIVAAVNRVIELKGGIVFSENGEVVEELQLPHGGVMSDGAKYVSEKLLKFEEILRNNGVSFEKPINVLHFLTFVTLPDLKLSNRGIVKVKERKIVPLVVGSESG
jgi:adenine deaminase